MPRKQRGSGRPAPPPKVQSIDTKRRSEVQPLRAPTGQPQGERKATLDAQAAAPMPNNQARLQNAIQQAGSVPGLFAGGAGSLMAPSARPFEPPTAGLVGGAGPGPSAIPAPIAPVQIDDINMAKFLPMLEAIADQPDASNAMRNYVRRVRGTLNPQITMESMVNGNTGPPA